LKKIKLEQGLTYRHFGKTVSNTKHIKLRKTLIKPVAKYGSEILV